MMLQGCTLFFSAETTIQHNHRGYWGASPGKTSNSRRYVLDFNYKWRGGPPLKWSWVQFPRLTWSRASTVEAHSPWWRCPCSPAWLACFSLRNGCCKGSLKGVLNKPLLVHHFTLHKTMYHAVMLWAEHLITIKTTFLNSWTVFLFEPLFSIHQKTVLRSLRWFYPEHDCMIQCLVRTKRGLLTEKDARRAPIYNVSKKSSVLRRVKKYLEEKYVCFTAFSLSIQKGILFFEKINLIDYIERLGKSKASECIERK